MPNEAAERVKALRDAYVAGGTRGMETYCANLETCDLCIEKRRTIECEAERRYPMPTVERPRVANYGELTYRVIGGLIQCRQRSHLAPNDWFTSGNETPLILALADLLANPTEQVPADEVTDA